MPNRSSAARVLVAALLLAAAPGALGAQARREAYGPALEDYRVSKKDFALLERALRGVKKLEPALFPGGVDGADVILQDTSDFYIYSRNLGYPYRKVKRWGAYQVYRVPHRRPLEHEMWGCAAGPPSAMEVEDRRIIAEHSLRCAPWGSFRRAQERKGGIYRFEEAYLATLLHEYGHLYEDMKGRDPTPLMSEGRRRASEARLPEKVEREAVARELFAQLCELKGSKELYPAHHRRLLEDARRPATREHAHGQALILAAGLEGAEPAPE